ncbi:GSCFA domain-containing protein [Primorskyibacter aestuariivivens]|uniref:GSCFA domain-containing protein n=1 Tax=Primorskyibacter aestuariivivens TaxID=1888912 RepID=UPI00230048A1|nr:GSCFA domain-containing protein [Primorskyibacter aestuariivivens]MDA7430293.1 GSCFA domain-containing protein [Primorskyibacter aestuariivivens]
MKILQFGNCQLLSAAELLEMAGHEVSTHLFGKIDPEHLEQDYIRGFDMVIAHETYKKRAELKTALKDHPKLVLMPVLFFDGFTPDDEINIAYQDGRQMAPMSRIAVGAFRNGLTRKEAKALYTPEFCDLMGYKQALHRARKNMARRVSPYIADIDQLISKWYAEGVFFHTGNHPKLTVVEDVLREILRRDAGLDLPAGLAAFCTDPLQKFAISPQANHPAAQNLISDPNHVRKLGAHLGGKLISCRDFVDFCYDILQANKGQLTFNDASNAQFDKALRLWKGKNAPEAARNPYRSQPNHAFWTRAVARPATQDVCPIGHTQPVIAPDTKVATAGSCFAQHVARAMVADGLTYYVAETAPEDMPAEVADARGYGLFSARYGNIYCARQLLQLIRRAYGRFQPVETAWEVEGGFVDPFRPNIGEVFESPEAVDAARTEHLASVREMFESLDVFVFTMGLTEGWVDRRDGANFPVAPAAITSRINPDHYEFVNANFGAVTSEMSAFLVELARINPTAKVILTVSPVPLIATYTDTDALSATTYSKSVLRAVAGDLAQGFDNVLYFPSYEIITGGFNRGAYFEDDLRSVKPKGVAHVMRVFRERLVVGAGSDIVAEPSRTDETPDEEYIRQLEVVCDEELLVR